ncbi:MAG: hypothetical protein HC866_18350 [Leptolyngbyaceae cyanobacterium RU_5_1]|nr:hypothetical protein [Leptolyngbyaceae cyanobacterium RU_5_1]
MHRLTPKQRDDLYQHAATRTGIHKPILAACPGYTTSQFCQQARRG